MFQNRVKYYQCCPEERHLNHLVFNVMLPPVKNLVIFSYMEGNDSLYYATNLVLFSVLQALFCSKSFI